MQCVEVAYHDEHGHPWRSVVVMRGQMELHAIARDSQVHRTVAFAILVIQRTSKVVDVEAECSVTAST